MKVIILQISARLLLQVTTLPPSATDPSSSMTMRSFSQSLLRGLLLSLAIHLSLLPACLADSTPDTLSITFNWVHDCAGECIDAQGHPITTLADVLNCDFPVYNFCYCPTNTQSIDSIRSWLSQCVSTRCGTPDFSIDVSAVESGYASYCIAAGYSQSGATTWFEPTSTQTAVSTSTEAGPSPGTTTQVTTATHTALSSGTSESRPQGKYLLLLAIVPLVLL
jgi:hypothetical protein